MLTCIVVVVVSSGLRRLICGFVVGIWHKIFSHDVACWLKTIVQRGRLDIANDTRRKKKPDLQMVITRNKDTEETVDLEVGLQINFR